MMANKKPIRNTKRALICAISFWGFLVAALALNPYLNGLVSAEAAKTSDVGNSEEYVY